ncbi:MAG: cytochrome D1 domain-containing protein [Rhodoferax sp.]|uniref:YVTN family beta-propeller repeat protein n=1 Tax=Rhodoferax sp. TaxID=50421 RepID=UPI0032659C66
MKKLPINHLRRAVFATALASSLVVALGGCMSTPASNGPKDVAPPLAGASGFVYSANEGDDSISRIDLATGRVMTLPVPVTPHNVQISRDGGRLFAVGSMAGQMKMVASTAVPVSHAHAASKEPGGLVIFDATATNAASATLVTVGRGPAHVVVDARGERAYVSNSDDDAVSVVDAARGAVVSSIATAASPHGLRMSPDGREIYVAATKGNAVSVIDVATSKELTRIPVGKAPVQVGFTPDGTRVYISLRDDNAVAVVDTKTRRLVTTIPVGRSPIQVFATPDGNFIYVANQGTEQQPDNTVSVIDVHCNVVVKTLTTDNGAHGVVVSNDGSRVFITNTFAGTVSTIDAATQRVVGSVRVGSSPGGITYRPASR